MDHDDRMDGTLDEACATGDGVRQEPMGQRSGARDCAERDRVGTPIRVTQTRG